MITLYNVISKDGFIARNDGSEDFIPDNIWENFLNLCEQFGTLIVGRKTYQTIQAYPKELLETFEKLNIKKFVITNNPTFIAKAGYTVVLSPKKVDLLTFNALVSSGPILNNYLLANHLVKRVIFHELPIKIGEGIKPFDAEGITLISVSGVTQLEGLKVREYEIA